jgi:hypothetical protein
MTTSIFRNSKPGKPRKGVSCNPFPATQLIPEPIAELFRGHHIQPGNRLDAATIRPIRNWRSCAVCSAGRTAPPRGFAGIA